MTHSDSEETRWLTLGEAADLLHVHRTTLRRWADEGQVPFMLTPGGHRRFAASDVDHLSERRHSVKRIGPVEKMWANQALERIRKQMMDRRDEKWVEQQDGDGINIAALGMPNFMIGLVPEADFKESMHVIVPGSRLYVYSDGSFEVRRKDSNMLGL